MNTSKYPTQTNRNKSRHRLAPLVLIPALASLLLTGCFETPPDETSRATVGADLDPIADRSSVTGPASLASDATGPYASFERRVALVIGNSSYGPEIGNLTNPANDAADMAEALRRTGFKVKLVLNAEREEMQRAVLAFDRDMRDSDVSLFYYAGHAVQVNGRNFLIPTGAKLDIVSNRSDAVAEYVALETLEIDHVLGRMGNAETDLSIVILDACRNNPFNRGSRAISRGLAQTSAPRGTFVAYATAPGEIALDGAGKNSPYTAAIVKNLKVPGLKLEDVFKRVRQDVAQQTNGRQIPWENSSIFGDFYFTKAKPEAEPATAALPTPAPAPAPENGPAALSREDYAEVQELLTRIGSYDGPITGTPDEKTRDAIIRWQALHGLDLDGKITKTEIPFLRTDAVRAETRGDPRFERRYKGKKPARKKPRKPKKPDESWDKIVVPPPPA